jgi:folate-binding protein YgfZ
VGRDGDGYWLVGSATLLPGILQRLRLFVLRARVEFSPAPEISCHGVTGGPQDLGGTFRPRQSSLAYAIAAAPAQPDAAAATGWKAAELRAGVAWLGPETTERFIPQMLGFDGIGAVSFSKGCYPGQEIVARARYLGRVKRRPWRLEVAGSLTCAPGAALRLQAGEEWLDGSLVDSAVTTAADGGESTVLLVVAPVAESPATRLEIDGVGYGCATM